MAALWFLGGDAGVARNGGDRCGEGGLRPRWGRSACTLMSVDSPVREPMDLLFMLQQGLCQKVTLGDPRSQWWSRQLRASVLPQKHWEISRNYSKQVFQGSGNKGLQQPSQQWIKIYEDTDRIAGRNRQFYSNSWKCQFLTLDKGKTSRRKISEKIEH